MKRKIWHIDLLIGPILAAIILAAYYFGSPRDPIKPVTTKMPNPEHRLLCLDGMPPVNWRCPDAERL